MKNGNNTPEEFISICTGMSNYHMKFCLSIAADYYKQCREVIHHELKNVGVIESPIIRIDSVKCKSWFHIAKNSPKEEKETEAVMCSHCRQLRREILNRISKVTESKKNKTYSGIIQLPIKVSLTFKVAST